MKKWIYLVTLIVLASLTATVGYSRDRIVWSINPMSATPTSNTLSEAKYITTGGRVKFKQGKTGTISFICQIPPFKDFSGLDFASIAMDYYQEVFYGSMSASIRRANRKTGAVQNVVTVKSTRGGRETSFKSVSNHCGCDLDFNKFSYWVQFTLKRSRIELTDPDDVSGRGGGRERNLAILNLLVTLAKD